MKVYTWQELTIEKMTNLYLYGDENRPANLVDNSIIRKPFNSNTLIEMDAVSFMKYGPGRYAHASNSGLVRAFFDSAYPEFFVPGVRKAFSYDEMIEIYKLHNPSITAQNIGANINIIVRQMDYSAKTSDYAQRSYIYNNESFKINGTAVFVIDADGKRYIDDLTIIPFDDNFDFDSGNGGSEIGNRLLEPGIDPSHIGRTVDIKFTEESKNALKNVCTVSYSDKDYISDKSNDDYHSYNFLQWGPLSLSVIDELFSSGDMPTRFLDSSNRPILYGTATAEILDSRLIGNDLIKHPTLSPYSHNGVVLVGGAGDDTLKGGGSHNDVFLGGAGVDTVQYDTLLFGKTLTISEREAGSMNIVSKSGVVTDFIVDVERINGTGRGDTIDVELLPKTKVQEIDAGAGADIVTVRGSMIGFKPVIHLGAGDDTLKGAPQGAIVYGDAGADKIEFSKNTLLADPEPEDRITYHGQVLTGGIRDANSESPWTTPNKGISYGGNVDGELVIRDPQGNEMFVANFNFDTSGNNRTAGILVGTLEFIFVRLMDAPTGYLYSIFETLLGPVMKALTGQSFFSGVDPLVLDLDGDGLELTARTAISQRFDIDGDGFAEQSGWVRSDDGFLVLDRNVNGKIDDVGELFGRAGSSGFAALKQLDSNNDGKISELDKEFGTLGIWRDRNGDAVTDSGELMTLAQAGVSSISLTIVSTTAQTIAGNQVVAKGTYTRANGTTGIIGDVNFLVNQRDTVWLGDKTVDAAAAALPEVKGYGTLTDLRIAVTDSPALKATLQAAIPHMNTPDLASLRGAITPVLSAWAGAVPVPAATAGTIAHVDVPIRTGTTAAGTQVYDFAFMATDASGTYWKLGSGEPVKNASGVIIAQPSYADILAQNPTLGAWTTFSGSQIQFLERYMGNPLPIGIHNLTGTSAINAAGILINEMWGTLNDIAARIAIQGPLAPYFPGTKYNVTTNHFEATTDRQIVPMLEAIFQSAPTTTAGAQSDLQTWKPILDVFLQDFDRGHDYLKVSYGFLFQNLVAAYENVGLAASLVQAAGALGIPADLIQMGTKTVIGTNDADLIYLGAGDQTLKGGLGPDTYVVGKNFGHDVIEDYEPALQGSPDMLRFAQFNAADVRMRRDGLDLVININSTIDELRIVGQFQGKRSAPWIGAVDPDYGIKEIVFANGEVWDQLNIAKAVSTNTSGNDTIVGTNTVDFLDGGPGNDSLVGAGEGDVYAFGIGSGVDTIDDNIGYIFVDSPDIVQFKDGIVLEDIQFTRSGKSNDLIIKIKGTIDQLTIKDQFQATYTGPFGTHWLNRIEVFSFADGRSIGWDDVFSRALELSKTSGNDTIYGFSVEDTLDGGAGDDYLSGGNENDAYIFGLGYGHDTIEDKKENILSGGDDTLRFKSGVLPSEIFLSRVGASDDLTIRLKDGSNVTIKGQFSLTYGIGVYEFNRIEKFEFSDGTVWTSADIMQRLINQQSTSGNDTIYGFTREDTLDGGLGNDYLVGGYEGDVYIYRRGDGNDTISDVSYLLSAGGRGNVDELRLIGVNSTDIIVERPLKTNDFVLHLKDTNDTITLKDQVLQYISFSNTEIEKIVFSDNIIFDADDLKMLYLRQAKTNGNDYIVGFAGDETLDGGVGDDTLEGGGNGDTYIFNLGYGHDVIRDFIVYITWDRPDTVKFGVGIKMGDLVLTHVGDDLIINIAHTTDQLSIKDQFYGGVKNDFYAIEYFVFSDGTSLDQQGIAALVTQSQGTSGNDTIIGSAYMETLTGKQGDDLLMGNEGSDTYVYNIGDGNDIIKEAQDYYKLDTDTLKFGVGIAPDVLRFSNGTDQNDLVIHFSNAIGSILLDDQFYSMSGHGSYGIEKVQFADGTLWGLSEIRAALFRYAATDGNDTITGYSSNDTISGGLGNDTMRGLGGDDTYIHMQGDGADTIFEEANGGGGDRLLLAGAALTSTNIIVARAVADSNNAILTFKGVADSVTLPKEFSGSGAGVERITFSDGVTWELADLQARYLATVSTAGNDSISGFYGNQDTINGGLGNDTMSGLTGDDTYIHAQGDGTDTIFEKANGGGADRLLLTGAVMTSANIIVARSATDSSDMILTFKGVADSISLPKEFSGWGAGVEKIIFGDGVAWGIADLQARYLSVMSTAGNDSILGFYITADTIIGGLGNDTMSGFTGDDTYIHAQGDGVDTILEDYASSSNDILRLTGAALTSANAVVVRSATDSSDMILNFKGVADSISLPKEFAGWGAGVEKIIFGEGVAWGIADLQARYLSAVSTSGNDSILGFYSTADTIIGGLGNDTMSGFTGDDIYIHAQGDGVDTILEDYASSSNDILRLTGAALTSANAVVVRSATDSSTVILTFKGVSDGLVLVKELAGWGSGIEKIMFSDGIMWTMENLQTKVVTASSLESDDLEVFYDTDKNTVYYVSNVELDGFYHSTVTDLSSDSNEFVIGHCRSAWVY